MERLIPLGIGLAVLALLLGGLAEPCYLVDDATLVDIPQLKAGMSLHLLRALFTWGAHVDYYPFRDLTYWVDLHLFGAPASVMSGTIFRLQNWAWFLFSGYLLAEILCESELARTTAYLAAGLWMALPMHFEMLMWISARKDVVALAFCLLFALSLLRYLRTGRRAWVVTGVIGFTLGQLSKASFSLVPAAIWVAFLATDRARERKSRAILFPAIALGLLFSVIQSRFYSEVNDMRYFYSFGYRALASVTALGRMASGAFFPGANAIDPENWGGWADLNRRFLPAGVLCWIALLIATWRARRSPRALPWVLALWATYAPVSALFFPHRMFYSIRYFELPFVFLWIAAFGKRVGGVRCPLIECRSGRWVIATVFALVLASGAVEARHWQDPVSTFRKAADLSPGDPATTRNLVRELSELDRWGRLDEAGKAEKAKWTEELREECGPRALEGGFRNGHLCEVLWSDEAFAAPVVRPGIELAPAIERSLSEVSPARAAHVAEKFRIDRELRDPNRTRVDPGGLASERLALPERRAAAVLLLCLAGRNEEAARLRAGWTRDLLLDDGLFFRTLGDWARRYPERERQLRACR